VCVCACVRVCVLVCVCVCVCVCVRLHTSWCVYMCMCTHIYINVCRSCPMSPGALRCNISACLSASAFASASASASAVSVSRLNSLPSTPWNLRVARKECKREWKLLCLERWRCLPGTTIARPQFLFVGRHVTSDCKVNLTVTKIKRQKSVDLSRIGISK